MTDGEQMIWATTFSTAMLDEYVTEDAVALATEAVTFARAEAEKASAVKCWVSKARVNSAAVRATRHSALTTMEGLSA